MMIEVRDLHKSFGSLEVLKGVNCSVEKSEVVCVIGPSGSGKSTFLRCLNRLEEATSGTIVIDGVALDGNPAHIAAIRREVGMVFQSFNLFPHMNVMDNVTCGAIHVKKTDPRKAREKALELLGRVGLLDKKDAYPGSLSGGQQQRVAIARALCMEPKIMLFDEPTSAWIRKSSVRFSRLCGGWQILVSPCSLYPRNGVCARSRRPCAFHGPWGNY